MTTKPTEAHDATPANTPLALKSNLVLGPLVEAAGMVNVLNHGSGSCVYSEGCHGVTQEHLERFAELVRAEVVRCDAQTVTHADGSRLTTCGSQQMRRAVGQGHAFKADRVHELANAGPFPGMSEAFDAHMGAACWTDPTYAPDASMWAAAWKAAKRQGPNAGAKLETTAPAQK